VSLHTVKPLDEDMVGEAFQRFALVVTVEEHSRVGGLGAALAEWLADRPHPGTRLLRFGVPDRFMCRCGTQDNARREAGLTAEAIAAAALDALERPSTPAAQRGRGA
jgi:transketolase